MALDPASVESLMTINVPSGEMPWSLLMSLAKPVSISIISGAWGSTRNSLPPPLITSHLPSGVQFGASISSGVVKTVVTAPPSKS